MKVKIDTTQYPVVYVTYPVDMELADIDTFITELRGVYARGRLAVVADLRHLASNPLAARASARQYLAAQLDQVKKDYPGRIVSEAVVASSPCCAVCTRHTAGPRRTRAFRVERSQPGTTQSSGPGPVSWKLDCEAIARVVRFAKPPRKLG